MEKRNIPPREWNQREKKALKRQPLIVPDAHNNLFSTTPSEYVLPKFGNTYPPLYAYIATQCLYHC